MEVVNDLLGYKNLKIVQNTQMFCFSLDSVLLPNFITLNKNTNKILDIGCGNAPMPLILSTKTNSEIIGVEIQKEVYKLAEKSVNINGKQDQIKIINADINDLYKKWESDSYDIIICNPPFFKVNEKSNFNNTQYKTIARHEINLDLFMIMKISKKLLRNNGRIGIVHRPERMVEVINIMKNNNIEPKKIQFIYPNINSESNIMLIEGRKNGKSGLKILPPIYSHDDKGNYTEQLKKYFK